jgi:RHS repeat-associated protein
MQEKMDLITRDPAMLRCCTGKPYDALVCLYNYGYQDYQPQVMRFVTVAPIRDGSNWFVYVNNAPMNWVDLRGFDILKKFHIFEADK